MKRKGRDTVLHQGGGRIAPALRQQPRPQRKRKFPVVGETGHGKTTFAKLLCRLADPTAGSISLSGIDLREVTLASRHQAVRMVPQDGFLFDASIRENVRQGREDATDGDVVEAFRALGLEWWVRRLPGELDTRVGERGDSLSVGERQFVALARAQIGDPGLLILDEATSAVDPETERALAEALARVSRGRTTITIAHRMSTAESADEVLVFREGRIVERGSHDELVAAGRRYASLYRTWLDSVVMVVRDQTLTKEEFLSYSRRFGRLKPHRVRKTRDPEHPELTVMGIAIQVSVPVIAFVGLQASRALRSY